MGASLLEFLLVYSKDEDTVGASIVDYLLNYFVT
jgi:hypothetical protein